MHDLLVLVGGGIRMHLEEKRKESHTLAWACRTGVTQGESLCARNRRCVAAACRIKPPNRTAVGRLRGMCGTTALARTEM